MLSYKITKISNTEQSELLEFYKKAYVRRHKSLINEWKWWYRFGHGNYEPLIILEDNKVIGQAAVQPIDIDINEKKILAGWFLDFYILPKQRGKGYGKKLIKELMLKYPHLITFCNKSTLNIVKNSFGWYDNYSTYRSARLINPLKFVPIINKFQFNFADNFFRNSLKKKLTKSLLIKPKEINSNFKFLVDSFNKRKIENNTNFPKIIRDENWFNWRILECPYLKNIYFFEYKNTFSIVHIFFYKNIKRLNILFSYSLDNSQEIDLFTHILNWSLENEIDLVWGVKTGKNDNIDNLFDKKFQKTLNFASWSSDESINKMLRNGLSNVEAIDSDIDSSLHLS